MSFKAHGGNREILVNDAGVWVVFDHQVDRPVNLLPHMATEALATGTAGRRELGDPLFFETGPQFGLPPAFFSIAFLTAGELAMETAIPFPVEVVMKFAMPTSDPTLLSDGLVFTKRPP